MFGKRCGRCDRKMKFCVCMNKRASGRVDKPLPAGEPKRKPKGSTYTGIRPL